MNIASPFDTERAKVSGASSTSNNRGAHAASTEATSAETSRATSSQWGRKSRISLRRVRIPEMLASIVLVAGIVLALLIAPWPGICMASGVGVAAIVVVALSVSRYSRMTHGVAVGAVAIVLLLLSLLGLPLLRVAAAGLANTFIDAWNAQVDGYTLHFAVSAVPESAAMAFALFVGIAAGLIVHAVCVSRSRLIVGLVVLFVVVLGVFLQTLSIAAFVCVALGGLLLSSCYSLRTEVALRDVPTFAVTVVVIVGLALVACVGYQGNDTLQSAKEDMLAAIDEMRFGSDSLPQGDLTAAHKMNVSPTDESTDRLHVVFADEEIPNEAEPLYMRGFVGSTYTGTSFERLRPLDYEGDWTGLFNWLDARQFTTLSQYAAYRSLDDAEADEATRMGSVEVQAHGAYRRYAYAPTSATAEGSDELLDLYRESQGVGTTTQTFSFATDKQTAETIVPGSWVYDQAALLDATGGSTSAATERAAENATEQAGDSADRALQEQDFLRGEIAYRSFVYDRYTTVPSEISNDIDQFFFADEASDDNDAENAEAGSQANAANKADGVDKSTLYSTLTRIRTMLDVSCDYNAQGAPFVPSAQATREPNSAADVSAGGATTTSASAAGASTSSAAATSTGGAAGTSTDGATRGSEAANSNYQNDYVLWFLHDAREGNSAAFASAAVLAFRQAGVPARYAEGYLLGEDNLKRMRELETNACTLSEYDAHAWVEVYVDGAGWMPVEVTPGFYDRAYSSDETVEIAREVAGVGSDDANTGSLGDEISDWVDQLPEELRPFAWLGLVLLILLLVLILIAALELQRLIRRHLYDTRLLAAQEQGKASVLLFRRMKQLINDAGVPFDDIAPHACTAALVQARDEVHPAEYQRVLTLMERERYGQIPFEDFEMDIIEGLLEKLETGNWERAMLPRRLRYRYLGLYLIPLRRLH